MSQEPGTRGEGIPDDAPHLVGGEGGQEASGAHDAGPVASGGPAAPGERPGESGESQPERPKYTPPSYIPPVTLDKDRSNATEPIPSNPTQPLQHHLPPGAPPIPGAPGPAAQQPGQQGLSQQGPPTSGAQSPSQQFRSGAVPQQVQGGYPGPQGQNQGQFGQNQGQFGQNPYGQPSGQPSPSGAQYPGNQYPGNQYPGAQPSGSQYPGAQYPGTGYQGTGYQGPAQGYPGYAQPGYGQFPYAPPAPKGLSLASMICGIAVFVGFGFFILPQIAAVVLGHMGLRREPAGRGFAIAGLVMGYVGVALTLLFLVFFIIAVSSARSPYTY
ncbi:DUF4190 domain-containing protein [Sinomonas flava]|uniref:DUF4190 domain-containing protein n=1 Tax=Sinomonas flava TaxID=496857 RepID=UPI0039A446A8